MNYPNIINNLEGTKEPPRKKFSTGSMGGGLEGLGRISRAAIRNPHHGVSAGRRGLAQRKWTSPGSRAMGDEGKERGGWGAAPSDHSGSLGSCDLLRSKVSIVEKKMRWA